MSLQPDSPDDDMIARILTGELSPSAPEVQAALERNPALRTEIRDLLALAADLDAAGLQRDDGDRAPTARPSGGEVPMVPRRAHHRHRRWAWVLAAAAAAALLAAWLGGALSPPAEPGDGPVGVPPVRDDQRLGATGPLQPSGAVARSVFAEHGIVWDREEQPPHATRGRLTVRAEDGSLVYGPVDVANPPLKLPAEVVEGLPTHFTLTLEWSSIGRPGTTWQSEVRLHD